MLTLEQMAIKPKNTTRFTLEYMAKTPKYNNGGSDIVTMEYGEPDTPTVEQVKAAILAKQQANQPREFKGFYDEYFRALARGGMNVAAGLAGTIESVDAGAIWDEGTFGAMAERLREISSQSKYQPSKNGGVKGFVANAVGETIPFMAGTTVATAIGGPAAAFAVAAAVEGDNAYQEAINNGSSQQEAEIDRLIVGTLNGAIEKLQVGGILKGSKAGAKGTKEIVDLARQKAWSKLTKKAGKLSAESVKTAIEEGLEEALQETVSIATPAVRTQEMPDINETGTRIGSAALGGAIAGGILHGAGSAINYSMDKAFGKGKDGSLTVEYNTPEEAKQAEQVIISEAERVKATVNIATEGNKITITPTQTQQAEQQPIEQPESPVVEQEAAMPTETTAQTETVPDLTKLPAINEIVGNLRTQIENAGRSKQEADAFLTLLVTRSEAEAKRQGIGTEKVLQRYGLLIQKMSPEEFNQVFDNTLAKATQETPAQEAEQTQADVPSAQPAPVSDNVPVQDVSKPVTVETADVEKPNDVAVPDKPRVRHPVITEIEDIVTSITERNSIGRNVQKLDTALNELEGLTENDVSAEQKAIKVLDQLFEIEKKAGRLQDSETLQEKIDTIKKEIEDKYGLIYTNPNGEDYNETRTDIRAYIAGTSPENLSVVDVIEPIIRKETTKTVNGVNVPVSKIVRPARAVVESKDSKNQPAPVSAEKPVQDVVFSFADETGNYKKQTPKPATGGFTKPVPSDVNKLTEWFSRMDKQQLLDHKNKLIKERDGILKEVIGGIEYNRTPKTQEEVDRLQRIFDELGAILNIEDNAFNDAGVIKATTSSFKPVTVETADVAPADVAVPTAPESKISEPIVSDEGSKVKDKWQTARESSQKYVDIEESGEQDFKGAFAADYEWQEAIQGILKDVADKSGLEMFIDRAATGTGYITLTDNEDRSYKIRLSNHDQRYGGTDTSIEINANWEKDLNDFIEKIEADNTAAPSNDRQTTVKQEPDIKESLTTEKPVEPRGTRFRDDGIVEGEKGWRDVYKEGDIFTKRDILESRSTETDLTDKEYEEIYNKSNDVSDIDTGKSRIFWNLAHNPKTPQKVFDAIINRKGTGLDKLNEEQIQYLKDRRAKVVTSVPDTNVTEVPADVKAKAQKVADKSGKPVYVVQKNGKYAVRATEPKGVESVKVEPKTFLTEEEQNFPRTSNPKLSTKDRPWTRIQRVQDSIRRRLDKMLNNVVDDKNNVIAVDIKRYNTLKDGLKAAIKQEYKYDYPDEATMPMRAEASLEGEIEKVDTDYDSNFIEYLNNNIGKNYDTVLDEYYKELVGNIKRQDRKPSIFTTGARAEQEKPVEATKPAEAKKQPEGDIPEYSDDLPIGGIYRKTMDGKEWFGVRGFQGGKDGYGNHLYKTLQDAEEESKDVLKDKEQRDEDKRLADEKKQKDASDAETRKLANKGKTPAQIMAEAKAEKALSKPVKKNGVFFKSAKDWLDKMFKDGATAKIEQKHAIEWDRRKYNRMDNREQAAYEKRYNEMVDERRLYEKDGAFWVLNKTEYDYFQSLERNAKSEQSPKPEQKAKEPWEDVKVGDRVEILLSGNVKETGYITNKWDDGNFSINFLTSRNSIPINKEQILRVIPEVYTGEKPVIKRLNNDNIHEFTKKEYIRITGERGGLSAGAHQTVVKSAVRDGKNVPLNVLQDYAGEEWADAAIAKLQGKEQKADAGGGFTETDLPLPSTKVDKEKQKASFDDLQKGRDYQFKYQDGERILIDKNGKTEKYMILSHYIQDGDARYIVYPPGKKAATGTHIWVHEYDILNKPKQPTVTVQEKPTAKSKIDDFGEKLEGARKRPETFAHPMLQKLWERYDKATSDFDRKRAIDDWAYSMMGDRLKDVRQQVMSILTGKKTAKAASGVNALKVEGKKWIDQQSQSPNTLYQSAAEAGAKPSLVEKAKAAWLKLGTESPYFKSWFGDSKVIDKDGKPLVVYHGTASDFKKFTRKHAGKHTNDESGYVAWSRLGFHFTNSIEYVNDHIDGIYKYYKDKSVSVMPVFLSIETPYYMTENDWTYYLEALEEKKYTAKSLREYFENDGYDGIVLETKDNGILSLHYIAFSPTQIKSVSNQGTFEADNPNILYQSSIKDVNGSIYPDGQSLLNKDKKTYITFIKHLLMAQKNSDLAKENYGRDDKLSDELYDKKAKYIDLAIKNAAKLGIRVVAVEQGNVGSEFGVIYFETPIGQISFHTYFDKSYPNIAYTRNYKWDGVTDVNRRIEYLYKNPDKGIRDYLELFKPLGKNEKWRPNMTDKNYANLMDFYTNPSKYNDKLQQSNQSGNRGSIEFTDKGAVITVMKNADASTLVHELGHLFLRDMVANNHPDVPAIRKWVGNKGGNFTREQEEKFARGWEAYLRRGKAPAPFLQRVFDDFKSWLKKVYKTAKDLDVKLNKDIIGVFDRMLGGVQEAKTEEAPVQQVSEAKTPTEPMSEAKIEKLTDKVVDEDVDVENPNYLSLKHADLWRQIKRHFGDTRNLIPSDGSRPFIIDVNIAVKEKLAAKAMYIAADVIVDGKEISRPQHAGLLIRLIEIEKEVIELNAKRNTMQDDDVEFNSVSREIDRLEDDYLYISRAAWAGNREAGRNLAFRKLTMGIEDYSLMTVVNKAKHIKGDKRLNAKERAEIEKVVSELESLKERFTEMEAKYAEALAKHNIRQGGMARYRSMTIEDKNSDLQILITKTQTLLKEGCYNG